MTPDRLSLIDLRPGAPVSRRSALLTSLAWAAAADVAWAAPASAPATAPAIAMTPAARWSAQVALDGVYIPALFLTGSAPRTPAGPDQARAAMQRLLQDWPARRLALAAVFPGDAGWRAALAEVHATLQRAAAETDRQAWPQAHETLEAVRETLFEARRQRGLAYLPDDCTAFHTAMEAVAGVKSVDREALLAGFARARALWRVVEQQTVDARALGLSPARLRQWQQGLADETAALARLSDALRTADDAGVLQAAAAIKAPFVRAYTALGWPPGETPELPR